VLLETWMEKKGWDKTIAKLPGGYVWRVQGTKRRSKRGRAMEEMLLGIKMELVKQKKEEVGEIKGIITRRIRYREGSVRIVGVYVNGDMEKKLEGIKEWMEGREERVKTIRGDFNAKTRREGGRLNTEREGMRRNSKDSKVNKEGRILVRGIRERGWFILNG